MPLRAFTEDELKIIKENSGKVNIKELSELVDWNYTSLSTAMNEQRIAFAPKRNFRQPPPKVTATMTKTKNSKGENIVTDELLKEWGYI